MRTHSSFPLVGLALDTPVRSRRNRIPDVEAAKAKIKRVVERATEALVKVSGNLRDVRHLRSHLDYISRNGKIEVETERGEVISTRDRLREEHRAWCDELGPPRSNERHTVNIVLSMPAGTDAEAVRRASRAFAKSVFGERNQYLMAVHHPGNDKDTKHPHAHLTVKARGYDGTRLDPKKADLQIWREVFAAKMRDQGGMVRLSKLREAAEGIAGRAASENPYRNQIIATQQAVRASWLAGAKALESSAQLADEALAKKIREFVHGMPLELADERSRMMAELLATLAKQRLQESAERTRAPAELSCESETPEPNVRGR